MLYSYPSGELPLPSWVSCEHNGRNLSHPLIMNGANTEYYGPQFTSRSTVTSSHYTRLGSSVASNFDQLRVQEGFKLEQRFVRPRHAFRTIGTVARRLNWAKWPWRPSGIEVSRADVFLVLYEKCTEHTRSKIVPQEA
jgi:hypothetical protein